MFFIFLFATFGVVAVMLRRHLQMNGAAEIWGWDYRTFVGQIQDWRWIGYFGFRHPGLGLVCSPLVALEHLWSGAYLIVMPMVATTTAWLIWKMSGWLGLTVWLSFPTTWLMAGVPESFPIAQLALVASCYWLLNGERVAAHWGHRAQLLGSAAFALLNTAITLTNGVKPMLGWLVLNWRKLDRKVLVRGGLAVVGIVLLGVGFFAVRSLLTGRGVGSGLAATLSWIPVERNLPRELYGFFIRPVGLWQSLIVYPLSLYGLYRTIKSHHTSSFFPLPSSFYLSPPSRPTFSTYFLISHHTSSFFPLPSSFFPLPSSFLQLLTSYFIVDVLIHLVVGWGMSEPWVFAPHWIWMLPILAGARMGVRKKEEGRSVVGEAKKV